MNITILSVNIATVPTAKGSYQVADAAFKNNTFQGKVEGKKVMSFGAGANSFKVLSTAQPGETYEVEVVKNDKGYNDWVSMQKAGVVSSGQVPAPTGRMGTGAPAVSAPRNTYETPEERAKKQVYIVRQSTISNAINILSIGAKAPLKSADVIKLAKELEASVFDAEVTGGATGFDDVPTFDEEFIKPSIV